MTTIVTNTLEARREAIEMIGQPRAYMVTISEVSNYTDKQRKALHLWCQLCAQHLNSIDVLRTVICPITGDEITSPWTKDTFKEDVYKAILNAITGKTSTNQQTRTDPTDVVETIRSAFSRSQCIILPEWPTQLGYWRGRCVAEMNKNGFTLRGERVTPELFNGELVSEAKRLLGTSCVDAEGTIDYEAIANYIIDEFESATGFRLPEYL